jgi:hypothetical protein
VLGDPDPQRAAALDAVAELSGVRSITVSVVSDGITNRNFRVDVGVAPLVVRLAGSDNHLLGIERGRARRRGGIRGIETGTRAGATV